MSNRRQQAPNSSRGPAPSGGTSGGLKSKQIKLVLLGESGVGKSSIALRFVRGEFNENGEATIGAAYLTKTINTQGMAIKFDMWDTAGQERYHSLAPMYYRGAPAAIVVYDITSVASFKRAQTWVKELLQQANSQIVIALVGNKADMANENRTIPEEEGMEFARSNGLSFSEVSAKTGMQVEDVFYNVASTIARQSAQIPHGEGGDGKNVRLAKEDKKEKGGGCC